MTVDLISQSQARFGAQMLVNVQDVRGEAAVEEVEDQAPRQRLRSIRRAAFFRNSAVFDSLPICGNLSNASGSLPCISHP